MCFLFFVVVFVVFRSSMTVKPVDLEDWDSSPSAENDVVVIGGGPGGYVAAIKARER